MSDVQHPRLLSGHIGAYDVFITTQGVVVINEERIVTRQPVRGIKKFLESARAIRLGWAQLPDFEVIYIYDKEDDYFGYAVNLQDPGLSEWGYAPFRK